MIQKNALIAHISAAKRIHAMTEETKKTKVDSISEKRNSGITILAETNNAFSAIDENGNTSFHLREGIPEDTFLTGKEAYDLFIESIKAYQMHKYGHLL